MDSFDSILTTLMEFGAIRIIICLVSLFLLRPILFQFNQGSKFTSVSLIAWMLSWAIWPVIDYKFKEYSNISLVLSTGLTMALIIHLLFHSKIEKQEIRKRQVAIKIPLLFLAFALTVKVELYTLVFLAITTLLNLFLVFKSQLDLRLFRRYLTLSTLLSLGMIITQYYSMEFMNKIMILFYIISHYMVINLFKVKDVVNEKLSR